MMHREIEEYLEKLKTALRGADPATIQDALADAEEHLTLASERVSEADDEASIARVIGEYGAPEEIAAAYRELETRTPLPFAPPPGGGNGTPAWRKFFGVVVDPRAYAALVYLFASLALGVLYFTIATVGLGLSVGLIVLVIGIPFVIGFLIAVRGIAVVEGRTVEALLGVRMPRRPVFIGKDRKWHHRIGELFSDRSTWTALLYLVLMLPLGILYFTIAVVLLTLSLSLLASPVFFYLLGFPLVEWDGFAYFPPGWMLPFLSAAGALLFILTLHFAKRIGGVHGRCAKGLLVKSD